MFQERRASQTVQIYSKKPLNKANAKGRKVFKPDAPLLPVERQAEAIWPETYFDAMEFDITGLNTDSLLCGNRVVNAHFPTIVKKLPPPLTPDVFSYHRMGQSSLRESRGHQYHGDVGGV